MYGGPLHSIDEYHLLHEATPCGAVIGNYLGSKVYERVVDHWGRSYAYTGVIARGPTGHFERKLLKPHEFILKPGLVYRMQVERSPLPGPVRFCLTWLPMLRTKI
jgi:hypothetical protein